MNDPEVMIRPANQDDADGVAGILQALVLAGKRRKRDDTEFALTHYIAHPNRISCFVAEDDAGKLLGFQSLKQAQAGNEYGALPGWGLIGTHIRPSAARRGVGKGLFTATLHAAKGAYVPAIEAFIAEGNAAGLAFYGALGFVEYRRATGAICKSLHLC